MCNKIFFDMVHLCQLLNTQRYNISTHTNPRVDLSQSHQFILVTSAAQLNMLLLSPAGVRTRRDDFSFKYFSLNMFQNMET